MKPLGETPKEINTSTKEIQENIAHTKIDLDDLKNNIAINEEDNAYKKLSSTREIKNNLYEVNVSNPITIDNQTTSQVWIVYNER